MLSTDRVARAILEAAAEAIIVTDRDGVIRIWNPGAERVFGFSSEEARGQSLDIIIPERLRARHWEGWRGVIETGRSRYGEGELLAVPGLRKDGSRVSLEFTIVPLKDADARIVGMAAVLRDVTARFEELRALRARLASAAGTAPRAG